MNEVIRTIANQLKAMGVNIRNKTLVKMNQNTLRVSGSGKNVDISYDRSKDLYNVKVHKIDKKTFKVKTCKSGGIYVDQLPDYFKENITKIMKCGRYR